MIQLKNYAASRWISLQGYTQQETEEMVKAFKGTEQFDGWDDDPKDPSFCLTFKEYKPINEKQIAICKKKNEQLADYRLKLMKQIVIEKFHNVYFNLNRLVIKKLR